MECTLKNSRNKVTKKSPHEQNRTRLQPEPCEEVLDLRVIPSYRVSDSLSVKWK